MLRCKSIMHCVSSTRIFLVIFALFASMSVGYADADEAPVDDKPWAEGVSAKEQAAALKLFETGNDAFGQRSYAEAMRFYTEAIGHWDHPAIRFNISECHIHLNQPVEAYENLQKALAYGAAPLEASIYDRALINKKLLEGQLAYLEVVNKETGAQVTLDGAPLMSKPGKVRRVIKPGRHQIVAKKNGRMTQTEELKLLPGETTVIKIRLPEIGSVPLVRRWSGWKPWATVAGGALVGLGGVGLQLRARQNMSRYDKYIDTNCSTGCSDEMIPDHIQDREATAELQDVISLSAIGVGAAVLTVGVVMVVMNQPRRDESAMAQGRIAVTPVVSDDGGGLSVSVSF